MTSIKSPITKIVVIESSVSNIKINGYGRVVTLTGITTRWTQTISQT